METIDIVLSAIGRGNLRPGRRIAAFALVASLPTFVVLVVILAIGPAQ